MRRLVPKALGALVTAAVLCLTAPGSTFASSGELVLNGRVFTNPSGCFRNLNAPLSVQNRTRTMVFVHSSPDCTGPAQSIPAGGTFAASSGHSVRA
ncbi:hypothetical protein I5Q34_01485 [Streptomyces sp. AV19]|uniref:hypothetical protein n=1 Tax=Streptomyces sp. AV19 TaxID=2793068 RepID=UPI0018FEAEBA|nr:hypothetical protein [Streptomyces sp. AV19]MBH1932975.1 hypothetical protein [Streptomyces sp. AV19]MDG4533854.1 hypothetical protein [Streptomyces sp. AV19]